MLYFIRNHQNYLKIGHTKNLERRLDNYKSHGSEITLLGTCEGTVSLERRLQTILYHKGLHLYSEWFKDSPIVYKVWNMAVNKRWKPICYLDSKYAGFKNGKLTPYDIYLYNPQDIKQVFQYDCLKPKIYKKHIYHYFENYRPHEMIKSEGL